MGNIADNLAWIAVDWGTSNLRVWLMAADGAVLDRLHSDQGMGQTPRDGFEAVLLELVGHHLPTGQVTPVICCGMAGSRQGWAEAPYAAVPCAPPSLTQARRVDVADPRIAVYILPGIKQEKPADVMRGEETQIAGFLAKTPEFDGVVCLPGTHSKWVHVSAGEVVSFQTFMTGEMFALLSEQSVLRHTVGRDGWDDAAFADAVGTAISRPAGIAAQLFSLRAQSLVAKLDPATARARLSGLLIGLELAAARPYWLGQVVAILGAEGPAKAYKAALEVQAVPVQVADAEQMTLEGLKSAHSKLKEYAQ